MIVPLKTKLLIPGYQSPYYTAGDKIFYNKFHAIKHCKEIGHKWPSYKVWEDAGSFQRPNNNFADAVTKQCELISDTSNKVRLFYSGGKDSNLILHIENAESFAEETTAWSSAPPCTARSTRAADPTPRSPTSSASCHRSCARSNY